MAQIVQATVKPVTSVNVSPDEPVELDCTEENWLYLVTRVKSVPGTRPACTI